MRGSGAARRRVTGDAGLWYHIGEIETAVRWKINSVTVVNKQCERQSVQARLRPRLRRAANGAGARALDLQPVNFARIGEEIGASASA